ncbi:MAG: Gfo/Idh/MocA family oxidoreductase [Gemmataceae bacterium]
MFRGTLSRRGFLQRSTLALAAAGVPVWFAREVLAAEEDKKKESDDTIKVGIIGIGSNGRDSKGSHMQSRARQLIGDVNRLNRKNIRFTAVCDVDARHLEEGVADLKKMGHEVKPYGDFRELTRSKDVDVVFVATPDHWHTLCAVDAMKNGKHIYCEKPQTLTVAEADAMVAAQKATGRVFQTGNQQRSDYNGMFRLACDLARNGRVGKIKRIEARLNRNPTSGPLPAVTPPEGLNWDFWLGPTPKVPYRYEALPNGLAKTNCHYEFRWWYDYSGGKMTDWGAHHIDIGQWALDKDFDGPVEVEGHGTPPPTTGDAYNVHEKFEVTYTYAEGTQLIALSEGENGVKIEGEDGKWIFVSRGKITASDEAIVKEPLPKDAPRLPVSGGHMKNFFDCVKSGEKPICHAAVGASSVIVCHIGAIALRLGKKLKWDPKAHKFDLDEANALLSRPYREPWKLEV